MEQDVADLRRSLEAAVRRVCPRWLADHAEDIVQNALLGLLRNLERQGGGNPGLSSIYLRKAAHGATVDEIRRRCRRLEQPVGDAETLERAGSGRADPERASASRELGRGIRDCLTQLSDPRRLAVTLYLRGCSVPEAARRLGWTVKRAEHLVYRGLRGLRECLASKGMAP